MKTITWTAVREEAVEKWGSFPSSTDETAIIEAFQKAPEACMRALDHVTERHASGKIRMPWRVWAMECSKRGEATVSVGPDREKRVVQAEEWIKRTGCHFDRESELLSDLFDGPLKPWADDDVLQARMVEVWKRHRPASVMLETEAGESVEKWKENVWPVLVARWDRRQRQRMEALLDPT